MKPTYLEGDAFLPTPRPERIVSFGSDESGPLKLFIGLKTITHNRSGLKIIPHKVAVIEMREGDTVMSFDLNSILADVVSSRLAEFAAFLGSPPAEGEA